MSATHSAGNSASDDPIAAEQERQLREGIGCLTCGTRFHAPSTDLDGRCPVCEARSEGMAYGRWAGRWAGAADILAILVKRLPVDDTTNAALAGYENLRAEWESRHG